MYMVAMVSDEYLIAGEIELVQEGVRRPRLLRLVLSASLENSSWDVHTKVLVELQNVANDLVFSSRATDGDDLSPLSLLDGMRNAERTRESKVSSLLAVNDQPRWSGQRWRRHRRVNQSAGSQGLFSS
tara:strand:- start:491 stop:874 length:384 start_codon:yes stop_codon:yes gene_type:complete